MCEYGTNAHIVAPRSLPLTLFTGVTREAALDENGPDLVLEERLAGACHIVIRAHRQRCQTDGDTEHDGGAKAEIHQLLDELACQGLAILVISSELPEAMNLSRRILVMRGGRIAGELARAEFSQPALMRLMAGLDG